MIERDLYADQRRGAEARALLDSPALDEAFKALEGEYLKAWRESKPADQEERERLWLAVGILGEIKRHLRIVVDTGAMAKRDIDKISGRR